MTTKIKTALAASFLTLVCAVPASADMATAVVEVKKAREAKNAWGKECAIKAQHPTDAASPVARIINEYINEELGGSYMGDLFDVRAMAAHYIAQCLEPGEDEEDMAELPPGEDRTEIARLAETDAYVTYEASTYVFLGGAHGVDNYDGMTFRKSDGRRMGWDAFVTTGDASFKELVKKGLKAYWEVGTDEELAEMLILEDDRGLDDIPRPQAAPLFTPEGVKLTYQPYEIAPYAAGMPQFVVPYAEIAPYLSRAAREMVKP